MINWIKYDPENPPPGGRYIVSDGKRWDEGFFFSKELTGISHYWGLAPHSSIKHEAITNYATINLPTED
ncbi:hypothetical protein D3C87_891550 [compost metagenome]